MVVLVVVLVVLVVLVVVFSIKKKVIESIFTLGALSVVSSHFTTLSKSTL